LKFSVCTTNYNCAHALAAHLRSVYDNLHGLEFEYVVVDNKSRDGSWTILTSWAANHRNVTLISKRSTIGEGREIAFARSSGSHIVVLDTDVVYSSLLRRLVDAYFQTCPGLSVQAIYCGIFPRQTWVEAGGRRSLNTNEDVDLWLRVDRIGTMRWYPVSVGENRKEPSAWGQADYLSKRYNKTERLLRLLRREWDFLKTGPVQRTDLRSLAAVKTIDMGLAEPAIAWPQNRPQYNHVQHTIAFIREFKQAVQAP